MKIKATNAESRARNQLKQLREWSLEFWADLVLIPAAATCGAKHIILLLKPV